MKKKIIFGLGMVLLLVGIGIYMVSTISNNGGIKVENNQEELFQGPVPEGYDEEHFRKTGETIPLEEING